MDDPSFSVEHEPALGAGDAVPDPAEQTAASVERGASDFEAVRDDVAAEPALPDHADPQQWRRWVECRRDQCTVAGNLAVTLLAAVLAGPVAIVSALVSGQQGVGQLVYVVLFGPVIEEIAKQLTMIHLLERRPYRLFAAWQFVVAGAVSGLAFGVIENLVYLHVYGPMGGVEDLAALAAYRWAVCTPLHVVCSTLASLGLVRVWGRQRREGRPADLSAAYGWFAVAIVLHGAYNLTASLLVSF